MKFLKHINSFSLTDYPKFDKENRKVFLIENTENNELLKLFIVRLNDYFNSHSKINFPIIRIADGEFQFLLGKNEFNLRKPFIELFKNMLRQLIQKITNTPIQAKSRTYSSGLYNNNDRKFAKLKYIECLKYVSDKGLIALYTVVKPNFYVEQYLEDFEQLLIKNKITLHDKNYVPFYYIYILLTNPKYRDIIYSNKNLHLVTSFNKIKKAKIEKSLYSFGAKSITWTKISSNKSLFDKLDLTTLNKNIDIIFVGGGTGKVNLFTQLKNIPALIIDAGYVFEIWQNDYLSNERDYCSIN
jgi:hypothetical protein